MSDRLTQLQEFMAASPDDSFLLFAMAKEYEKINDSERAMEYYLKLQEKDPDYIGLYYHLGKLYEQQEEIDKALETYSTGMQVAKQQGDQHALSELAGAKLNIADDEDDFI